MASPVQYPGDENDIDDTVLWAMIDSAAASYSTRPSAAAAASYRSRKTLTLKHHNFDSPRQILNVSSPSPQQKLFKSASKHHSLNDAVPIDGHDHDRHRPTKISRSCVTDVSEISPNLAVVKHRPPVTPPPVYTSPESAKLSPYSDCSPRMRYRVSNNDDKENTPVHCLSGRFPTVSLFKEYQDAAMSILDKSDYTLISGNPFIKKSGWRKIAFYFNVSFEIKDKTIEFDDNRNVQRAEFVVRAYMQGGRFSDGWGSCERREKRFTKPNNDIPSTAETRAKNKACQDLLGIGEYRPGVSHNHVSR